MPAHASLSLSPSSRHSFASLSASLVAALLPSLPAAAAAPRLLLRVTFPEASAPVFVVWGGLIIREAAGAALPPTLSLARAFFHGVAGPAPPPEAVVVRVEARLPPPSYPESVEVEAASVDEWEVLEANAAEVEAGILEQMAVLPPPPTRFPFFLAGGGVVSMRVVGEPSRDAYVLVGGGTRLLVRPTVRMRAAAAPDEEPEGGRRPLALVARLQPCAAHGERRRVAFLRAADMRAAGMEDGAPVEVRSAAPRASAVVRAHACAGVRPGHAVLPPHVRRSLALPLFATVAVRAAPPAEEGAAPPGRVVLRPAGGQRAATAAAAARSWLRSHADASVPLHSGAVVPTDEGSLVLEVAEAAEEDGDGDEKGRAPRYWLVPPGADLAAVAGPAAPDAPRPRAEFVAVARARRSDGTEAEPAGGASEAAADATDADSDADLAVLPRLGAVDETVAELRRHLVPLLSPSLAAARSGMAPRAAADRGVLLCGPPGCGKTSLARGLAASLRHDAAVLASTVWVPCAALASAPLDAVRRALARAVRVAVARAPSLVVLDDADALTPPESEQDPAAAVRSAGVVHALDDLLAEARHRHPRRWTAAVAVVKSPSSFHPALQAVGLFPARVDVPPLDAAGRADVVARLLPGADADALGAATEGFSAVDLAQVARRARHAAVSRALDAGSAAAGAVAQEDVDAALDGFVPASLRDLPPQSSTTEWEDVGGLADVKRVLRETLELPSRFARLFERVPLKLRSGLLLYGPPGCGKTLLASAVARECGLSFISVKGPELLNKYIGASEQSVRDQFARAAAAAPCVLFFDEFEAIAPARGGDSTGVTDRVVNQFLCHLDGVESRGGVYVLAATSRPDLVDPALLRPGRLDKALYCGFPADGAERLAVLRAAARRCALADDADLAAVASRCDGFSGADLAGVVTEARMAAASSGAGGGTLAAAHFEAALAECRPSVSRKERARFDRIYDKFLRSRSDQDAAFDASGKQRQVSA